MFVVPPLALVYNGCLTRVATDMSTIYDVPNVSERFICISSVEANVGSR